MAEIRKHGAAATINFPMIKVGSRDFAIGSDWTPVAGDVQISKDEGAFADAANLPIHEGRGSWSLALAFGELNAARIIVSVIDSATKAVEDQEIIIDTYGSVSAQHEFNLDAKINVANGVVESNLREIRDSVTGALALGSWMGGAIAVQIGAAGSQTTTVLKTQTLWNSEYADQLPGCLLVESDTGYSVQTYAKRIVSAALWLDGGTDRLQITIHANDAFPSAPVDTDIFRVISHNTSHDASTLSKLDVAKAMKDQDVSGTNQVVGSVYQDILGPTTVNELQERSGLGNALHIEKTINGKTQKYLALYTQDGAASGTRNFQKELLGALIGQFDINTADARQMLPVLGFYFQDGASGNITEITGIAKDMGVTATLDLSEVGWTNALLETAAGAGYTIILPFVDNFDIEHSSKDIRIIYPRSIGANTLYEVPASGGDATLANQTQILSDLAAVDTVVDAVKVKTDNLPADPASETNVNANETKIDIVDTVVDAIKLKTDALPADPASETNVNANETKIDAIKSETVLIKAETDKIALVDAGAGVSGSVIEEVENRATPTQVKTQADQALVDVDLDHLSKIAAAPTPTAGSNLDKIMNKNGSQTFSQGTDSLEAIRDNGDSAWASSLLQATTIATLASQTNFTLTAGSGDNDAYNGGLLIVTDSATNTQKAVGIVKDYIGSSKTIILESDPGIFTMAVGDSIAVIAKGSGDLNLIKKFWKNKNEFILSGGKWYWVIYDNDNTTEIHRGEVQKNGGGVIDTLVGTGTPSIKLKSSV